MSKKSLIALLASAILLSVMLCACGDKQKNSSEDSSSSKESAVTETTAVLETTAEGGTVEQDSEGNKITKDKDGIVIAVEDKDGNPIEVTQYVTTHSWVEQTGKSSGGNDNSQKTDDSGNSAVSDNSSSSVSDGSNDKNGNRKDNPSAPKDDEVEGEIPVIIATLPDDEDLAELPDL